LDAINLVSLILRELLVGRVILLRNSATTPWLLASSSSTVNTHTFLALLPATTMNYSKRSFI
jgi:hypothetical protein